MVKIIKHHLLKCSVMDLGGCAPLFTHIREYFFINLSCGAFDQSIDASSCWCYTGTGWRWERVLCRSHYEQMQHPQRQTVRREKVCLLHKINFIFISSLPSGNSSSHGCWCQVLHLMPQRQIQEFDSWVIMDGDNVGTLTCNYELGAHETICCTGKKTLSAEALFQNTEMPACGD